MRWHPDAHCACLSSRTMVVANSEMPLLLRSLCILVPTISAVANDKKNITVHFSQLKAGGFVLLPDALGIGRLESVSGREAVVTLFHSFVEQEDIRFPVRRLTRAFLYPGTRVYLVSQDSAFGIGRVTNYDLSANGYVDYEVQFPNRRTGYFSETDLRVRCWRARGDPNEILAAGIGEAQFLHDRRMAATRQLIEGRASAQGITGIISSGIEFVPHQISAVRRILSDPHLRYLLADEVGLGKTVEAGIVIRQILIDDPDRYICVLVPQALVSQWRSELRTKFYVDDFLGTVEVLAYEECEELERTPDLLVIDEAHHIVGNELQPAIRARISELAQQVPRLLLLSATPALSNPETFLSLLSLLDPSAYRPCDLDTFKHKLAQRQEFGRLLLGLIPDSPGIVLRRRAADAKRLFPGDPDVEILANRLENATVAGSDDIPNVTSALSQHIADTYRINQRVIRARRSDAAGWEFQPRGPVVPPGSNASCSHIRIDDDEDRRIPNLVSALEDWRATARSAFDDAPQEIRLSAALRYRDLVEALGISVDAFAEAVMSREILFPGEEEVRTSIRSILASDPGPRGKLDVVVDGLRLLKGQCSVHAPKVVAFCSATSMAQALHKMVTRFDPAVASAVTQGLPPDQTEAVLNQFANSADTWLLIVDRNGEEGLNLNFADAIVHVDLPLSATRIEQRIGRVDRFGRRKNVIRHRILLPFTDEGSVWTAWHQVLAEGFRVYCEPISDVQFLLDELDRDFALAIFDGNAMALQEFVDSVRQKVISERKAQDEQYALDRLALANESVAPFIETMDAFEETEREFGQALSSWLVGALQLTRYRPSPEEDDIFCVGWGDRTLVPRQPWETQFGLDVERPMTWLRRVAVANPGVVLERPGSPLLDSCSRFMRWDDRGATFLTLRVDPGWPKGGPPWMVFKLCFIIEPDLPQASTIFPGADDMSALRRAERFLPASLHTVYLDVQGTPVTDVNYLAMLERPYCKSRDGVFGDVNLGSRPELLGSFIDPSLLRPTCLRVRDQGATEVLRRDSVVDMLDKAARLVQSDTERRRRRLVRRAQFDGTDVANELLIDKKIELAVMQPHVRLDAIGLFIICGEDAIVRQPS